MASQDIPNDPHRSVLEQMNDDVVGVIWDRGEPDSQKGLHLRIFESGKRCFYFLYSTKHKCRRRPKIGEGISLTEARRIARIMREQISIGIDPKGEWDKRRDEKTVAEAYEEVFENYWDTERFEISGRKREVTNIFNARILLAFGNRKLSDVKIPEVRVWHNAMRDVPIMANRALEVLSKIFNYSVEQEWVPRNPCLQFPAFKEVQRKRVPTKDELKKIIMAYSAMAKNLSDENSAGALYLLAIFYTGSRPMALAKATWDHVKSETEAGMTISLPGKMTHLTNEDETVFIPKQIVDILKMHDRRPDGKIFSVEGTRTLWDDVLEEFEIKDLWKRDARKAFASLGLSKGLSIDLIGNALNHRSASTTKRYAQEFDNGKATTTTVVAAALDDILRG